MTDEASKIKGFLWLAAACLMAAMAALGLSPLMRAVPWSWEQKLSQTIDSDDTGKTCPGNPEKRAALDKLIKRLYPLDSSDSKFTVTVRIVNDSAVNAYAGLGGKISVNQGLLRQAKSADELAGVLAHEMEHVRHRHILENIAVRLFTTGSIEAIFGEPAAGAQIARYFLDMSFTRTQEAEADQGGLMRLQKAHIDTRGFKNFFERMEESTTAPAFLSDHPSNGSRAAMADEFQSPDVKPIMTNEEWQRLKSYCQ